MDSFVCNLHLHVQFNFPLGWTCVKLALKCPSVKTQCLGGCFLFYLKFILRIKSKQPARLRAAKMVTGVWSWKSAIMAKASLHPRCPEAHPKASSALLRSSHQRDRSLRRCWYLQSPCVVEAGGTVLLWLFSKEVRQRLLFGWSGYNF